jgi:hypothetical protein
LVYYWAGFLLLLCSHSGELAGFRGMSEGQAPLGSCTHEPNSVISHSFAGILQGSTFASADQNLEEMEAIES